MNNLYTIPSHYAFADALCLGIKERFGDDLMELADMLILLPNRRSCRALKDAFLRHSKGKATLLPRMMPLGEMEDEEWKLSGKAEDEALSLPQPISTTRQQLLLARMIRQWKESQGNTLSVAQATKLAAELADFLSEIQREQKSLENLHALVPEHFAEHWQITLDFLNLLRDSWPSILAMEGKSDPVSFRNQLLTLQMQHWQKFPPKSPVIAAGSTGSIPATASLLSAIAAMENGMVILPGLDTQLDTVSWQSLGVSHPQYGLKNLLELLKVAREDIQTWEPQGAVSSSSPDRHCLISEIMRPAETATCWSESVVTDAMLEGFYMVEAEHLREEAGMIAVAMREVLEMPGKTAALVTHDRDLARYTAAALKRWNIQIDDSAGRPLAEAPEAVFLWLVVAFIESGGRPFELLACLKHPYAALGRNRVECRKLVRVLEKDYLRGVCKARTPEALLAMLQKNDAPKGLLTLMESVCKAISPVMELTREYHYIRLSSALKAMVQTAEMLAASETDTGDAVLWKSDAGEQLREWLEEVLSSADIAGKVHLSECSGVLDALLEGQTFRPRYGLHPRLHILSPLEARLQHYDMLILGGLNEGSWPGLPEPDPWMSRPMREHFGLPVPEKRIGQAAHDFVQCFCAREVLLTRSRKSGGAEATPSRWLLRLQALLMASGRSVLPTAETPWLLWCRKLQEAEQVGVYVAPEPAPSVQLRPRKLSATRIATLQQNPYAIYAQYILRLRELEPIDKEPGALEFGNFIHSALDRVNREGIKHPVEGQYWLERLLEHGRTILKEEAVPAYTEALWWPRFVRIAENFIAEEAKRRQHTPAVYTEINGKYVFESKAGDFTLVTKADRVEVDDEGILHLIDYKTGTPPTKKQVELGLAPQMPLEGLIARQGGFDALPEDKKTVTELSYWKTSGRKDPLQVISIARDENISESLIEEADAGLKALVEWFDDEAHPYHPYTSGEVPMFDSYAHLIRKEEWEV